MAGGKQFSQPNFSDAVPPDPIRQGSMGPEGMGSNRVDENTFESGQAPQARNPIESDWMGMVDTEGLSSKAGRGGADIPDGVRGYRPSPVGGTYNPGQGTSGRSSSSAMKAAPVERSNTAY